MANNNDIWVDDKLNIKQNVIGFDIISWQNLKSRTQL